MDTLISCTLSFTGNQIEIQEMMTLIMKEKPLEDGQIENYICFEKIIPYPKELEVKWFSPLYILAEDLFYYKNPLTIKESQEKFESLTKDEKKITLKYGLEILDFGSDCRQWMIQNWGIAFNPS